MIITLRNMTRVEGKDVLTIAVKIYMLERGVNANTHTEWQWQHLYTAQTQVLVPAQLHSADLVKTFPFA